MAATLDVNFISMNCIDIFECTKYICTLHNWDIQISEVFQIDNWLWEKKRKIKNVIKINDCLDKGKIIVVSMISKYFKDIGLFIEKINKVYIYTFWINTENYPKLDEDNIQIENYLFILKTIDEITEHFNYSIDTIAIGVETNFVYKIDKREMINCSDNISAWFFYDYSIAEDVYKYKKVKIDDKEIYILVSD